MRSEIHEWLCALCCLLCACTLGCEGSPELTEPISCVGQSDCPGELFCNAGVCQSPSEIGCTEDTQCPPGFVCLADGRCQEAQQCAEDADCCAPTVSGCSLSCVEGACLGTICSAGESHECFDGCHKGVEVCTGGLWSVCDAAPLTAEVCGDGVDNDCNGKTDEGCGECEPGAEQECEAPCGPGTRPCGEDRLWGDCLPLEPCECDPGDEGEVDCGNCGVGVATCAADGSWTEVEVCTNEGECAAGDEESQSCGVCGVQVRTCGDECTFGEFGECTEAVGGCEPGETETRACGVCGQQERVCGDDCTWGEFSTCQQGAGECIPGEELELPCGLCGSQIQICHEGCGWEEPGECVGESGVCTPGGEKTEECGKCGERVVPCTEECQWGEPQSCLWEGACYPDEVETKSCGTGEQQIRICGDDCAWGEYSDCASGCGAGTTPCTSAKDGSNCCTYSQTGCEQALDPLCPGCACKACVCLQDSYCCETGWDGLCVTTCSESCGGCGLLNDGCQVQSASGASSCDGEVDAMTGHCYKAVSGKKSFYDARDDCQGWGGDLATIHFQQEGDFVHEVKTCDVIWIGLTDGAVEGSFKWVDGTELKFNSWKIGEPNNQDNEDCVEAYDDGSWNDENCGDDNCYVCEKSIQTNKGCDGCSCESCVCAADSTCCSTLWDDSCAQKCATSCGGCGFQGCQVSDAPGCEQCPCQDCVCAADDYCCSIKWDSLCVERCESSCGGCAAL